MMVMECGQAILPMALRNPSEPLPSETRVGIGPAGCLSSIGDQCRIMRQAPSLITSARDRRVSNNNSVAKRKRFEPVAGYFDSDDLSSTSPVTSASTSFRCAFPINARRPACWNI